MSAAVANLAAARCSRRSGSPAKAPLAAPIKATMDQLKQAVRWRDDMPGDMPEGRLREVVGITALHLGFCALSGGVELDLGNGYIMTCTVRESGAACAG